jgi:hypothetical protein
MKKLGVNQNQVESFMIEVYGYGQRIGLAPQDIASNLLLHLSRHPKCTKGAAAAN